MTYRTGARTMLSMSHYSLDAPPSLSGIDPIVQELQGIVIELWNLPVGVDDRPLLRRLQVGLPQLVRMFTERMRQQPTSPQEIRFWQRVHAEGDHLIWTGMGGDEPRCDWTSNGETKRTTPARVAWLLLRAQDVPYDQHLRRLCDRIKCIAPDHHSLAHDYSARPSMRRIRKDVLSDGTGGYIHARCGNPLGRLPRPGRKVYCSICYQEDQRLLKAAENARLAQLYPRSQAAYTPPAPVLADMPQAPEPVMLPQPKKTNPPVITQALKDAAMALFDDN